MTEKKRGREFGREQAVYLGGFGARKMKSEIM